MAAEIEMAGDDKAVARVVPLAAADRHRAGDAQPAEHVGHAPAGVLHQHQPGETVLLLGQLVDAAGLLAGKSGGKHVPKLRGHPSFIECQKSNVGWHG